MKSVTETARQLRHLLGVTRSEPPLTLKVIVQEYPTLFPSIAAARHWIKRSRVPYRHRGRLLIVERADLEAAFR